MRALVLCLCLSPVLLAQTPNQNPQQMPTPDSAQPQNQSPQMQSAPPPPAESDIPQSGQNPNQPTQQNAQPQSAPGYSPAPSYAQPRPAYAPAAPQANSNGSPYPVPAPEPSEPGAVNAPVQTANPGNAPAPVTLPLWPNGVPGGQPAQGSEANTTTPTDAVIAGRPIIRLGNVSDPTLTLYQPSSINSGAAVVVFPGGGYQILAMDLEGTEVCHWLTSIGVNCVLVKYRVPNSGPFPKSPAALQDAQRAMGLVRQHAGEWGIDSRRVGVLGFSAGAHLAAALSTHFEQRFYPAVDAADQLSCRPDFALIIYPGYLALAEQNMAPNPDIHVTAQAPPTFILQAENDPVHVENAITYFTELKQAGVPAELHIYAQGGHGYGLRSTNLPITRWPRLAETWLRTINVLQ